jgi:hypothetical protein
MRRSGRVRRKWTVSTAYIFVGKFEETTQRSRYIREDNIKMDGKLTGWDSFA